MIIKSQEKLIQSNYNLKYNNNSLINNTHSKNDVTLERLEAIRTSQDRISASKFGLEVICGLSCETGAL